MIILPTQVDHIDLETIHLVHSVPFMQSPYVCLDTIHLTLTPVQSPALGLIVLDTVHLVQDAIDFPTPLPITVAIPTLHLDFSLYNLSYLELSAFCATLDIINALRLGGGAPVTPNLAVACEAHDIIDNLRTNAGLPSISYDPTDPLSNLINALMTHASTIPYAYDDTSTCRFVSESLFPVESESELVYDVLILASSTNYKWRSYDGGVSWIYGQANLNFDGVYNSLIHTGLSPADALISGFPQWLSARGFAIIDTNRYYVNVTPDLAVSMTQYNITGGYNFQPSKICRLDQNTYFLMGLYSNVRITTDLFATTAFLPDTPTYPNGNHNMCVGLSSRLFLESGLNGQKLYYADSPYDDFKTSYDYTPSGGGYPAYKLLERLGDLMLMARLDSHIGNDSIYVIYHSESNGDSGSWVRQSSSDTIRVYSGITNSKAEICDVGEGTAFMYNTCRKLTIDSGYDLLKTTDSGYTWEIVNIDFGYHYLDISGMCYLGNGVVLMSCSSLTGGVVDNSYIYRSTDRGLTWTEVLTLRDFFPTSTSVFILPNFNSSH